MIHTLFYFFLALLLLIVIHEFGHFIVARMCGVRVLRFSFGFGKVLFRWKSKKQTEYVFSLFPLGGYVKMLDESEGEVVESDKKFAFNNKPLWARTIIVLAGPAFNFLFAFWALWLMWVVGFSSLAPMVESVKPNSLAYQAGLRGNEEIITLNSQPINSWRDFQYAILPYIGSDEPLELQVRSLSDKSTFRVSIPTKSWALDEKKPDLLNHFGIKPFLPKIPPVVGEVVEETPAFRGGIQTGDEIKIMDGRPVQDWIDVVKYVQNKPGEKISLTILRDGQQIQKNMMIGTKIQDKKEFGFLGVKSKQMNWPSKWLRKQQKDPWQAAVASLHQTYQLTGATFSLIGRLIVGDIPVKTLSGPIGIAQGAGESAKGGLAYYLSFLALVSISLGVLNLLPIPMLDGGHLLFYLIEFVQRKPLSDEAKSIGMYMGLLLLMIMMVVAVGNDIVRLSQ